MTTFLLVAFPLVTALLAALAGADRSAARTVETARLSAFELK